jgi:hypothetical protein
MKFFLGPRNNLQQSGRADLAGRINNLQSGRADLAGRINNLHATSTIWPGGPNTIQYNTIQYNTIQYNTTIRKQAIQYARRSPSDSAVNAHLLSLMTSRAALVCTVYQPLRGVLRHVRMPLSWLHMHVTSGCDSSGHHRSTTRGAVCPRELEATGNSHTGGFPPAEGTVAVAENCSLRGAMALRSSLGQHNTIQYNTIQYNTIQYNTNTIRGLESSCFQISYLGPIRVIVSQLAPAGPKFVGGSGPAPTRSRPRPRSRGPRREFAHSSASPVPLCAVQLACQAATPRAGESFGAKPLTSPQPAGPYTFMCFLLVSSFCCLRFFVGREGGGGDTWNSAWSYFQA